MPKIHVLDKQIAELIAAGEVVERPSSVIKELVENSIDAGASAITVEIQHGGITYMRVTDNGCGISREDVPNAFLRHATSKVRNQQDLEQIHTLGFRGEALASVAAVAHVELFTRTEDSLAGTHYRISAGEEEVCEDAGCAPGTTILVRDLFYNTPARMKFLKKDMAEGNSVAGVLDKLALSHPEISFRFLRDGKEALHTPGDGKLKSAVYAVFGREFTAGLIPVEYEMQGVKVKGLISRPSAARPNRSMQHFFINGRYVKSRTAAVALEEGFKGSLMVGKQPACVLHVSIPCESVDVNVHPAKIEVRFINERPLFDCIYYGVKTALNQGDTPKVLDMKKAAPAFSMPYTPAVPVAAQKTVLQEPAPVQKSFWRETSPQPTVSAVKESFPAKGLLKDGGEKNLSSWKQEKPEEPKKVKQPAAAAETPVSNPRQSEPEIYQKAETVKSTFSAGFPEPEKKVPIPEAKKQEKISEVPSRLEEDPNGQEKLLPDEMPLRVIGELFGTYILVEHGKDELLIIDKHAAHERMLYESLKEQKTGTDMQILLQPVPVSLDKNEYTAVLESVSLFAEAGFELEDFGSGTVLVRSAPMALSGEDAAAAVMEMAGYLLHSKNDLTTEKLDWLYHNVACRAAVKAGDESSPMELAALALRLQRSPEIRYCPHGRPVSIVMKRKDLERQFGRI